ncbi:pentapeptide repeat-containing protein [Streptomyces smyrnaeus]|uniref:Pentapeptide repeat-containing protein n=1 Tax=Streptomyces smyrnaeus TaxID=1387713 RepID=A0ABS3XRT0_9ACTN|nr:pentapeptide repeat-containing protein [Streptomyces smyrnaeus]MBO8198010.1 pentapeptide repeat-containing protein [Streptomyces smyrnaeus]
MTGRGSAERLRADCANCAGLCCVALPFTASADFAVDKPGGKRCGNLTTDNRCSIHARLRESGFTGCAVFDCFGAGQRVTGRDGLTPGPEMFAVFRVTRQLHELLWLLTEAEAIGHGEEAPSLIAEIDALVEGDAEVLRNVDVDAWRARVGVVLEQVSHQVRDGLGGRDLRRADLMGARLRGERLRGASLRGALLIAADLRGADLRRADLLGADLRDADLRGADLSDSLFVTQAQVNAARGDAATAVPDTLTRPAHWLPSPPPGQHEASQQARGMPRGKATPVGGGTGVGGRSGNGQRTGRGGRGKRNGGTGPRNGTGRPGRRTE